MTGERVFSRRLLALAGLYFVASLAHFSHNAEYIAFYPGMPLWLTPEKVYIAWLGVTSVGVMAALLYRVRLPALALLALMAYGALGLAGLAHYTLGLCAEHTLVANVTIWSEAALGTVLSVYAAVLFVQRVVPRLQRHSVAGGR